jgi:hypothetical protein
MGAFCSSMDVMLFFETPFVWPLIDLCRERGIKTVLMPMYECMPKVLPAQPDLFLCPSLLDLSYYPPTLIATDGVVPTRTIPSVYLPIPVEQRWYQRDRAEVFVHNAGHGGLKGRNGTQQFLEAIPLVRSPAKFVLRVQDDEFAVEKRLLDQIKDRLMIEGTLPYDQLFMNGDVFVFPEQFQGLSLPLQEARAAGMLVMSTDRFPSNMWLPNYPLIEVSATCTSNVSPRCNDFEQSMVSPTDIAAKVDEFYGADISEYSREGRDWAKTMSWEVLRPKYLEVLEQLCQR